MGKYQNLWEMFEARGRKFAEKCTSCGDCLEVCPVFSSLKCSRQSAPAVMQKVCDLLLTGEASEEAAEWAFACNGACNRCSPACPEGLMPFSIVTSAIGHLRRAGTPLPPLSYQLMPGHPHNFGNLFSSLQIKPAEARWTYEVPAAPEPVDMVFFTGCAPLGLPHLILETMEIFDRMGLKYATLAGAKLCCGSGSMIWGDFDTAQKQAQDLVSAIAAYQARKAVFFCHGCYVMNMFMLPRFVSIPFESAEVGDFLAQNIDSIPFKHRVEKVITPHDSCANARIGMVEPVRKLLEAIPGVSLVEMEHNRLDALCCGGLTNINQPEITEKIRRQPMEEAQATGAEIMATVCSGCVQSFVPLQGQYPFEVQNYISLIAESVGVRHKDHFAKYVDGRDASQVMADAGEYIAASNLDSKDVRRVLPEYLDRYCLRHGRRPV